MFIKHIRSPRNWEEHGEFVFECHSYSLRPMVEANGDDGNLLLVMTDKGDAFEVHKDSDELYIMNDNGRTIDSYAWPKTLKRIADSYALHEELKAQALAKNS